MYSSENTDVSCYCIYIFGVCLDVEALALPELVNVFMLLERLMAAQNFP